MAKYTNMTVIQDKYDKLPYKEKVVILYNALDFMEEYNGRSKIMCIAMAMGYENHEGGINTYFKKK